MDLVYIILIGGTLLSVMAAIRRIRKHKAKQEERQRTVEEFEARNKDSEERY